MPCYFEDLKRDLNLHNYPHALQQAVAGKAVSTKGQGMRKAPRLNPIAGLQPRPCNGVPGAEHADNACEFNRNKKESCENIGHVTLQGQ